MSSLPCQTKPHLSIITLWYTVRLCDATVSTRVFCAENHNKNHLSENDVIFHSFLLLFLYASHVQQTKLITLVNTQHHVTSHWRLLSVQTRVLQRV